MTAEQPFYPDPRRQSPTPAVQHAAPITQTVTAPPPATVTTADPAAPPTQDTPAEATVPAQRSAPSVGRHASEDPTGQQPATGGEAPAPKRSRLRDFTAFAVIIVVVAAVGLGIAHLHRTSTAVPAPAYLGCDPGLVQISPMLNGVTVYVTTPGPNKVSVDVWDGYEHRRMFQQVTKNSTGATFSLWAFTHQIRQIDVTLKNGGTCSAALNGLHR